MTHAGGGLAEVGARLVLMGKEAYIAGMREAEASQKALASQTKATAEAEKGATAASKAVIDTKMKLAEANRLAKAANREYETAVRAQARAEAEAAAVDDDATKRKATLAKARTDAALAAKTAADTEVAAAKASADAAVLAADKEIAARKRVQESYSLISSTAKTAFFGVAAVAGVATVASVKMAGDFEASTTRLVTSANESKANLDMVRHGILDMAAQVGYSTSDLATAMYKVESGGQHGAAGLMVLKAAAEGAKTENADLTTVADAVTTALIDYHLKATDAGAVTSKMVQATASGKMTFEELAGALSSVAPVASAAHISLDDMLGTLASMTSHGISAQQATQNMADTIRHLQSPTGTMRAEMNLLGVSADDVASHLGDRGLAGTMEYLQQAIAKAMPPGSHDVYLSMANAVKTASPAVQDLAQKVMDGSISMKDFTKSAKDLDPISAKQATAFAALAGQTHQLGSESKTGAEVFQTYGGALQKAVGDATGLKVALMTTGENAGYTNDAIKAISGTTTEAGGHVKGWAEIQENFNQKLSETEAGAKAAGIQLGTAFLPSVSQVVGVVGALAGVFAGHTTAVKNTIAVVGILVGLYAVYATTVKIVTLAQAAWVVVQAILNGELWTMDAAIVANPIGLIVVAIVAAVAAIAFAAYEIVKHWGAIKHFFSGLWDAVSDAFGKAAHWIGDKVSDITGFVGRLADRIGHGATQAGEALLHGLEAAPGKVLEFFRNLPQMIGFALGFLIGRLLKLGIDAGEAFVNGVVTAAKAIYHFFTEDLPHGVMQALRGADRWLRTTGLDILRGLRDGTVDGFWDLVHWWQLFPHRVMDFLRGARRWLVTGGRDVISGLGDGIDAAFDWLLHDLPRQAKNLGMDIVHGLINGFTAMVTAVWNMITGFVRGFIDGIKRGMGISSPSTVMHDIGMWVLLGFIHGIQEFAGGVADAFRKIWADAKGIFIHGANSVIDIVNGFLGVVNKIAGAVGFHIDLHIPHVPELEAGGVMPVRLMATGGPLDFFSEVGSGFVTNRPRAIVGEGNPAHPEFVVPTDPTHRGRALDLFADLARYLMPEGVPGYDIGGVLGDVWGGITSGAKAVGSAVRSAADWAGDVMAKGIRTVVESVWPQLQVPDGLVGMVPAEMNTLRTKALDWLGANYAPPIAGGAAAPAQVMAWIIQALDLMRMGHSYAPGISNLIMHESGGNPSAINRTDSNARAGHPSQGLMQTIPSTFHAYVLPSLANRPITDPVANITAGVRYAMARYGPGMLMAGGRRGAGGQYIGYEAGGVLGLAAQMGIPTRDIGGAIEAGQPYLVGESGPEIVVPAAPGIVIPPIGGSSSGRDTGGGQGGGVRVGGGDVHLGPVYITESGDPKKTYDEVRRAVGDALARR